MRLPTTLALLVFVGGLAYFIFRYEPTLPDTKQKLAEKARPLHFETEKADAIEIIGKDLNVQLHRKNNRWHVATPFADRANQKLVKQLLDQLSDISWLQTLRRNELKSGDWKRAGLGENTATEVTVSAENKVLAQCKFGGASALDDIVYASSTMRDGSEVIHLAKGDVAALLHRPADDWRDAKLLDVISENIEHLTISAGPDVLEFIREPKHPWMLVKPLQIRAADERVNGVLAALLKLEVKPQSATHAPVLSASAGAPVMKISIEHAASRQPVDIVLQPASSVDAEPAVSVSDRPGFFTVPKKIADIWRLQPNILRDQRLARLPKDAVDAVSIRSAAFPEIVLSKQGETWMLKRHGAMELAHGERVQKLIEGLNAAQVEEFAADAPTALTTFGLQQPFLEVEWRAAGKTSVLQFGKGEQDGIFSKYADEPFVYRIGPQIFAVIPPDSVKWRGLAALDLSIFSVRRIVVSEGMKPPTLLNYDPNLTQWQAEIAGKDVTAMLVRPSADSLLNKLCKLPAVDWTSDHTEAYKALQKPSLTVQVLVVDPRKPDTEAKTLTIAFAPTVEGMSTAFYHARINNDPDTFLISREVYRQLTAPVVK